MNVAQVLKECKRRWGPTGNADHIGTIWSALNGIRAAEKLEEAMLALRDARMLLMMNRAVAGSATMTRINNVIAEAKEVLR